MGARGAARGDEGGCTWSGLVEAWGLHVEARGAACGGKGGCTWRQGGLHVEAGGGTHEGEEGRT